MQQADQTGWAARQLRAKNAVLRNFCQAENETPDSLKQAVSHFVGSDCMKTDAVVAKTTRFSREGDASPGLVIVEFGSVADKKKVFRTRGKLAGCNVGLDDDLTPLQQKQKAAAWDKFCRTLHVIHICLGMARIYLYPCTLEMLKILMKTLDSHLVKTFFYRFSSIRKRQIACL